METIIRASHLPFDFTVSLMFFAHLIPILCYSQLFEASGNTFLNERKAESEPPTDFFFIKAVHLSLSDKIFLQF